MAFHLLNNWVGQDITAKLNECKTKTFSKKTVQGLLQFGRMVHVVLEAN